MKLDNTDLITLTFLGLLGLAIVTTTLGGVKNEF